ncbi:MAG: hypothetical protein DMG26_13800, partial [Acidobacteria bacterium]
LLRLIHLSDSAAPKPRLYHRVISPPCSFAANIVTTLWRRLNKSKNQVVGHFGSVAAVCDRRTALIERRYSETDPLPMDERLWELCVKRS